MARIQWMDINGQNYSLDTDNPELAASWLREQLINYLSGDGPRFGPPRISIYPSGGYNFREWSKHEYKPMDTEALKWLIEGFESMKPLKPTDNFELTDTRETIET